MAEKSLNDIARELQKLHRKGLEALQRENFDYAIDLFSQVLEKEPTCYEVRESLRNAQLKKAEGSGRGFFKKAWSSASSSPLVAKGQLALRRDPMEAIAIAEQILNGDPQNSAAHKILAEAAQAAELPRTAVLSFEILVNNSPKDKDLTIQLANALAQTGQNARAERLLGDLYRANPTDNELATALKNSSARKTLNEGGYQALSGGQGSYRDILKDKEEAVSLEQQNRQVKTEDVVERLIKEKEAQVQTGPKTVKLLRDLGELYMQKKQFDKALDYFDQVKTLDVGSDSSLDRVIAEATVRRFGHTVDQLDQNAPDYAEKSAQLQAEKQAYQIAECQKRAEKFPTDLAIRFELGQLYFQAGKVGEAIPQFQRARENPHKRIAAMNYLAQCFAQRKMFDLAAEELQNAIKEKVVFDEEKKELIYNLGCVLENMNMKAEAIAQFKIIYKADSSYKDVEARVVANYAGQ